MKKKQSASGIFFSMFLRAVVVILAIVIVCLISYFFSGTGGIYSEQHPRKVSFAFTCIPFHGNHEDRH